MPMREKEHCHASGDAGDLEGGRGVRAVGPGVSVGPREGDPGGGKASCCISATGSGPMGGEMCNN